MLKEELSARAAELGFARMFVCPLPDYRRWRARVAAMPDRHFDSLTDDVSRVFPGECAAVALVWPYRPYEAPPGCATVSAYYPASDASHRAALELARWLVERGYRAVGSPNIPFKPVVTQSGHAAYGRNGVTGMAELGSRYTLQLVLTDAPLERDAPGPERGSLSRMCEHCDRCVRACPTGALDGTGRVNVYRCVRARSDEYPMDEAFRPHIGRSLYGCDVCQDVCPRNAQIRRQAMPEALRRALRLERLLAGDVADLAPYIGKNYARKARIQAKACVIAANLGRSDLLPRIEACLNSPVAFVQAHAQWAMEALERGANAGTARPEPPLPEDLS